MHLKISYGQASRGRVCRPGGVGETGVLSITGSDIMVSPLNRMTDRCKNITFPQLRLRAVNILNFQLVRQQNPIVTDECQDIHWHTGKHIVSTQTELNSEYDEAELLSSAVQTLTVVE